MTRRAFLIVGAATILTASAYGQLPVIDGTIAGDESLYGAPLSIQNTDTGFGDAAFQPDPINSGGGSEINQVFGAISGGNLNVAITGNLEANFNKLVVFLDVDGEAGGVNTLVGSELPTGLDPFCGRCGGGFNSNEGGGTNTTDGGLQNMDGLTFDAGFNADYALVFTHGFEGGGGGNPDDFYALSVHFADLTQGTAGEVVAAGIALAPQGLPNVLRAPTSPSATGDHNSDTTVDASDFVLIRDNVGAPAGTLLNDATGADPIGAPQFEQLVANFGATGGGPASLSDPPVTPSGFDDDDFDTTPPIIGPALPGLSQGQLIDQNYATDPELGGCSGEAGGAGCIAPELEFVLPVDAVNDPDNTANHRNFDNTIGILAAIDNSNNEGVTGGAAFDLPTFGTNPDEVETGVEFSIPLESIGLPVGDIALTAFINGSDYDFASNQFSGDGILSGNLGSDGAGEFIADQLAIDLSQIAGDQFVTIPALASTVTSAAAVPEPSSVLLVGLAAAIGAAMRRRAA